MPVDALEARDLAGYTALYYAALASSLRAVAVLVSKKQNLLNIVDKKGQTLLLIAARYASESNVLWYLALKTSDVEPNFPFIGPHAGNLILALTVGGYLYIMVYLLQRYPSLATAASVKGFNVLRSLASTPSIFFSSSRLGFWERWLYTFIPIRRKCEPPYSVRTIAGDLHGLSGIWPTSREHANQVARWLGRQVLTTFRRTTPRCIERLQDRKLRHHFAVELVKQVCKTIRDKDGSLTKYFSKETGLVFSAARWGITEMLTIILQLCPDLIWLSKNGKTLIHFAIKQRQKKLFNLLSEKTARSKIQSEYSSSKSGSILHLAAKLAPYSQLSFVSGSALQMQSEIQWFKAVEKLVHPHSLSSRNDEKMTPRELFTKEHRALAEAGEKWMKDTSNSCMIVTTLIATVVFASAFTIPGGNYSDTNAHKGVPILLWDTSFLVFSISDALALSSSLTSLLTFLSILTARYAEEDFLLSLLRRLILGLAFLFFAIITMMIAFGATLFIALRKRLDWISIIPISLFFSFRVTMFALSKLHLFYQTIRSTFGSRFRPQSPWT